MIGNGFEKASAGGSISVGHHILDQSKSVLSTEFVDHNLSTYCYCSRSTIGV